MSLIIAEIGTAHGGSLEKAKEAAAESDFIKKYIPEKIFDIYCR